MKYNFDKVIDRRGTNSLKYDFAVERGKPADILPLWVADMDFRVPDEVSEALIKLGEHGIYGYSEVKDSYFEALRDWMDVYHDWKIEPEWLVKTPGVVFALATAVKALTREGDAVMIQSPVYYPFQEVILDNERKLIDNTLVEENGKYRIDYEDFENKILEHQVKLFLLCSPHNPVGRVWRREELEKLADICHRHGVYVVSDEIHQDFIYSGHKHVVFSNLDEKYRENVIVCTAPSKTFNLAGLQVSNIFITNPEVRKKFQKEIAKTGYSQLNIAGLTACEAAYRNGREWLEELKLYLTGNLDFLRNYLEENLPRIHLTEPEGTYLVWLDFRDFDLTDKQLERIIVGKAGLWLDRGSMFGPSGQGFERINIACPRQTLHIALNRLKDAVLESL